MIRLSGTNSKSLLADIIGSTKKYSTRQFVIGNLMLHFFRLNLSLSKETVVLRKWESKTKIWFYQSS